MAATSHFTILQSLAVNNSFANERGRCTPVWSPQLHYTNRDKGSVENDAGTHLLTPRRDGQVEELFIWAYPHLTALPREVPGRDIYWRSQFVPQVPHRASMCSHSKWGGFRQWFYDLSTPVFILSTTARAILLFFHAGSSVVSGAGAVSSLWVLLMTVQPQHCRY